MEGKRFCIVTVPRTGSNYLCGALSRHSKVICHYEIFHPEEIYAWAGVLDKCDKPWTLKSRNASPLEFLNELESVTRRIYSECASFGFKLFVYHNPQVLDYVISSPEWRVIVLSRDNKLAQFSSEKIARATGIYVANKDQMIQGGKREIEPIIFEKTEFVKFCNKIDSYYERVFSKIKATDKEYFLLEYKDIANQARLRSVVEYLGLEWEGPIEGIHRKQNTQLIIDRFVNKDVVSDTMMLMRKEDWLLGG